MAFFNLDPFCSNQALTLYDIGSLGMSQQINDELLVNKLSLAIIAHFMEIKHCGESDTVYKYGLSSLMLPAEETKLCSYL